jgi:hypothetical protein
VTKCVVLHFVDESENFQSGFCAISGNEDGLKHGEFSLPPPPSFRSLQLALRRLWRLLASATPQFPLGNKKCCRVVSNVCFILNYCYVFYKLHLYRYKAKNSIAWIRPSTKPTFALCSSERPTILLNASVEELLFSLFLLHPQILMSRLHIV